MKQQSRPIADTPTGESKPKSPRRPSSPSIHPPSPGSPSRNYGQSNERTTISRRGCTEDATIRPSPPRCSRASTPFWPAATPPARATLNHGTCYPTRERVHTSTFLPNHPGCSPSSPVARSRPSIPFIQCAQPSPHVGQVRPELECDQIDRRPNVPPLR